MQQRQIGKVLITGAAGMIGQVLTNHLKDRYDLVLTDIKEAKETFGFPFTKSDITDLEAMRKLLGGIHTVIHLAADFRRDAPWESLLPNNIIGCYNVFQAAHEAGCQRIIFASSINSVDGYGEGIQIHTNMPVAPLNVYGASKAWGEALGRFYADQKNISVHCLRLGWVTPHDSPAFKRADTVMLSMALTHRDMLNLFDCCLESSVHFGIFHGISDNTFKRLDISDTKALIGYAPIDDAFALAGLVGTKKSSS